MTERRGGTVPELTIQPTAKFIKAGAVLAIVVVLGLDIAYLALWTAAGPAWLMAIPLLLLLWPGMKVLRRRLTKTTITGDRLRYETGMATKSTRNIQLSKIQDVRVDQRLMQRVFNVGNISIETAGEASRLTIHNVDAPQDLADEIMNRVQKGPITA
jgi:uncharacterized membrane protein YdbT with pleckstrin-like domain